jgi:hypothetical protein
MLKNCIEKELGFVLTDEAFKFAVEVTANEIETFVLNMKQPSNGMIYKSIVTAAKWYVEGGWLCMVDQSETLH